MNNPPAHMRSIWSPSYTTLKNSTPFSNMMGKALPASFPIASKDRLKMIPSQPLTEHIASAMVKRKFESLEIDATITSSSSSSSWSGESSLDSQEAEPKKSRIISSSNDSNELVSQYSSSLQEETTTSVYFRDLTSKELPSSPLVIKVRFKTKSEQKINNNNIYVNFAI